MELSIVKEAGLDEALIGMRFSFKPECSVDEVLHLITLTDCFGRNVKVMETAKKLCKRDGGHNKFIEQIQVWMILRAPLYFWKQLDTYRVGTSKLSKSTMHTLMKRQLRSDDFVRAVSSESIEIVNRYIQVGAFDRAIANLPDGYLQTRMVNTNYKVLRNIIQQREGHKLQEWDQFIREVTNQLDNPELLGLGVFL